MSSETQWQWDAEADEVFFPDCADEALGKHPRMARPCAECPGTEGTKASKDPVTPHLLSHCIERRFPFWCHLTSDGEFSTHLCAGWADAVDPSGLENRTMET